MVKYYMKPTLELVELKLNDVIMYSPPQQETYETPILLIRQRELENNGELNEFPTPTEPEL